MSDKINRVVLAYSGGLDTSVILKWLQQEYQCEVVTFTADLGQGEELEPARRKAEQAGVKPEHIFIDDLKEEFLVDAAVAQPPGVERRGDEARARAAGRQEARKVDHGDEVAVRR
jgi:argininosuccinate synthase